MKKVRRRVVPLAMSTSRSSVAISSAPTDQVQAFCQMMFDLPLDAAGQGEDARVIGRPVDMAGRDLGVQHLVAAHEIVAPKDRRDELLARAGDAAEGDRALGREQVAVLPAQLEPHALAGAVARLAGDGAHRRRLERDGEVDEVAAGARDRPDA